MKLSSNQPNDTNLIKNDSDIFKLTPLLSLKNEYKIELYAKYTRGNFRCLALRIQPVCSVVLLINGLDHPDFSQGNEWSVRLIPWFESEDKFITALSFDERGYLFIGTKNGSIYEINIDGMLNGSCDTELTQVFHLDGCKILDIVIWFRDTSKIILANGDNGKFILIQANALPILVTFNSSITAMHLFTNVTGLSSLLVCLQNSQNVITILDDLEMPIIEDTVKKSIFRRAKENIVSRFGDSENGLLFGKKTNKESSPIPQEIIKSPQNNSQVQNIKFPNSSNLNIKFSPLEEDISQGLILKTSRRNQFFRQNGTRIELLESDLKVNSSVNLPENISKVFIIDKMFCGIDKESRSIRLSVLHSQMLKEFAVIKVDFDILSVESISSSEIKKDAFMIALFSSKGVFQLSLRDKPIELCADLLIGEMAPSLFEVVCTALNVAKNDAYISAGNKSAEEGKFAKTILYYKVAGMSYSKIVAKFGSRKMIPAMLCFYDLVDNEKTKYTGTAMERNAICNIILQGRIEQYLRFGTKNEPSKDPKRLLSEFIRKNEYYSSALAADSLTHSELVWAAQILSEVRLCHLEVLNGIYRHRSSLEISYDWLEYCKSVLSDWMTIYTIHSEVFYWLKGVVQSWQSGTDKLHLISLVESLLPWRREVLRKFFCEVSDVTETIDFLLPPETLSLSNDAFVTFFIYILLEAIIRDASYCWRLPKFYYKMQADHFREKIKEEITGKSENLMFEAERNETFAASPTHCVCIRNGRLYSWGDNSRHGRLGIALLSSKFLGPVEYPESVKLSPALKLVIKSVSCGQEHTIALTSCGTVLMFGSNRYGQLGVGKACALAQSPTVPYGFSRIIAIQVCAGAYHTVVIDHLNRVWTFGWGVFGQLGYGGIETLFHPRLLKISEKIVMAAAGHAHTCLLTITGKVITFGCNHFGQLGQGTTNGKVKVPCAITIPTTVHIVSVECGVCSSIFVTRKNRIYYSGINPRSIRNMLSGSRKKDSDGNPVPPQKSNGLDQEEKDFSSPVLIDSTLVNGDVVKVSGGTTHFAVLTSDGLIYTWGLGKNGQLMRPDDGGRCLSQIVTEDRQIIASNVICAGECSWIVEKGSGKVFGFGYNSAGQLGKMEVHAESGFFTIKTNKRVLRVKQPSNVHFKAREIIGLPKISKIAEAENLVLPTVDISPPTSATGQELLNWTLVNFFKKYNSREITALCTKYNNHEGASIVYKLEKDHENVLKHQLAGGSKDVTETINNYLETKEKDTTCLQETHRFIEIVIQFWIGNNLSGKDLENILMPYYKRSPWNSFISLTLREMISETNDRSKWIAGSFTPSFILACIRDSKVALLDDSCKSVSQSKTQNREQFDFPKFSHNGISTNSVFHNGDDSMC